MKLVLKESVATAIGVNKFKRWGVSGESFSTWRRDSYDIDLARTSPKDIAALADLLSQHKSKRGVQVLLQDIAAWQRVTEVGVSQAKARTVKQFADLLTQYLL